MTENEFTKQAKTAAHSLVIGLLPAHNQRFEWDARKA